MHQLFVGRKYGITYIKVERFKTPTLCVSSHFTEEIFIFRYPVKVDSSNNITLCLLRLSNLCTMMKIGSGGKLHRHCYSLIQPLTIFDSV